MDEKSFTIRFLPLFEEDLNRIVDYIALRLKNPMAAEDLTGAIQQAIEKRAGCADAFEVYPSARERKHPYYRIYVKNYVVYYVLIGDVMEVRRILYRRQNAGDCI